MSRRRLGFVLSTPPESGDLDIIVALARAALGQGIGTELFAMSEGVLALDSAAVTTLSELDCEITVCATSRHRLGLEPSPLLRDGGQDDHAALHARCQRVLAFT